VVGGGPAGLAAALACRRQGLAVACLEARRPPLDKACGEGVMPAGLAVLERLGVEPPERAAPLRGVRYRLGEVVADGDFPAGARGLGVRRTLLSAALVEAAERAGVELVWGARVEGLTAEGLATAAGAVSARYLVGADGLRSRVRRWAGLERPTRAPRRFGVVRHFRVAPPGERVEVWFGARAEAYVTPLAADEIGVALLWEGEGGGFDALLASRLPPELGRWLAGGERLGPDRGAGPFHQATRGVIAGGRVALVGDAAGYVDALTGEGLALALESAEPLAAALAAGELAAYARAHRRLARGPQVALAAARRPPLARRGVAALARDPELFSRLLGALGAGRPLTAVGLGRALRFARALLLPSAGGRPLRAAERGA
jgi:flavin-dependent dehydrogenase